MGREGLRFWATLTAALLVASLYSGFYALRGWIPHDEGLLGQMAERVLDGELPHIDFDEPYSGGLTFLNAVSFAVFGHRLSSLRVTLFLFHVGFLASVFSIGARAGSLAGAALITLLCVSWGLPNYFAGLPSWYNLGFAIFGIHAALKYAETDKPGWLCLAGFLGGMSCLFKVAGIYLLAGLFVFVIYREDVAARRGESASPTNRRVWPILIALVLPIVFLVGITWARLGVMEFLYFIFPGTVVCGIAAWNALQPSGAPLHKTARSIGYLVLGAVIPVGVFLLPYALRGDLYSVYRGLFVLPQLRFDYAFYPVPPASTLVAALLPAAVVCVPLFSRLRAGLLLVGAVVAVLAALLVVGSSPPVYSAVWYSVRPLGPIAAILLCVLLVRRRGHESFTPPRQQMMFLMATMAAFLSVIQFPYAFGIYFYYAAPPILLALLFASSVESGSWRRVQVAVALFYLGFGALWLNSANMRDTGVLYRPSEATEVLLPDRANLRVTEADKALYEALVSVINEVAGDDPYIFATPDCPEIYFLSRRKNPTRIFYEFFDPVPPTPEQLLADLERKQVRVVVLNGRPEFSPQVSPELYKRLEAAYPEHVNIGWFRVLWKT